MALAGHMSNALWNVALVIWLVESSLNIYFLLRDRWEKRHGHSDTSN